MSPIVIDASITCSWAMPDEMSETAVAAMDRVAEGGARVPWIWWFEVRNGLLMNERRKRIGRASVRRFLTMLRSFRITLDEDPDEGIIMELASRSSLSFYDGAYLDLAARFDIPLATLDRRMATAAREAGVVLLDEQ